MINDEVTDNWEDFVDFGHDDPKPKVEKMTETKTTEENRTFETLLDKLVQELSPRMSTEKAGLAKDKIRSYIAQLPYELSQSVDYIEGHG